MEHELPIACGAFTPTEILTAWEQGAGIVKVFPARKLGPQYIRDVLAPLPELKLMPTGGVSLDNVKEFLEAGAHSVGVGGNIVQADAVAEGDWKRVTQHARSYAQASRRSST
jgi:2-dehydro-3-deoxyphosphogluconate aldolase/(4S)-4-hydroxy-2-oxoglutarate aldolase